MDPARLRRAVLLLILCACAASPPAPDRAQPVVAVYLVAHEKHSGIALRRAEVPDRLWPEIRDFPQADYLEVGWGDRDYYYGRRQGILPALRAAFWPGNQSVLHVAGVRGTLAGNFPASEIVEVMLTREGFERLLRYIHDAYDRGGAPAVAPLGGGLYGDSRFYPGRETFNLLRTCNVWTASALREAGLPIEDSIRHEWLMTQARAVGRVVQLSAADR